LKVTPGFLAPVNGMGCEQLILPSVPEMAHMAESTLAVIGMGGEQLILPGVASVDLSGHTWQN